MAPCGTAPYVVTTTLDSTSVGSLRWAYHCCTNDTIDVPTGTYNLTMGSPLMPGQNNWPSCTLLGQGRTTIIDGLGSTAILNIQGQWHGLVLKRMTLRNGYNATTASTNFGSGAGGAVGVESNGVVTIDDVTFSGNSSSNVGGAVLIFLQPGSNLPVEITNSTFTNNVSSQRGGAVALYTEDDPIVNVLANNTFVNNSLTDLVNGRAGAVLFTHGTNKLYNNTWIGNDAGLGCSQFYHGHSGSSTLINNILATAGHNGNCGFPSSSCQITDGGGNISDDGSCGFTAPGSLNSTDPRVDPAGLADNGGVTDTVALCRDAGAPAGCTGTSPAINAGANATCAVAPVNGLDQRGYYRPGFGQMNCSIGAFEAYSDVSTPTPTPTITPTPTKTPTPTVTPTPTFAGRFIRSQGLRLTRPAAPMRMEHGNAPLSLHPVE